MILAAPGNMSGIKHLPDSPVRPDLYLDILVEVKHLPDSPVHPDLYLDI